ncbi:polyprenyl synthetase family protein [Kribbella antibiotica]|uniref:Polyprenyl synthetase family protein n=1 Tax=Kribbella antibiotica TaxID=190195 RepID=A0A4V2YPV1_9ACTN|nr:family 2 encapsulin nanocompartment cargo protein polyprenyl transferase [Kribbella antibiotica]TDD59647.1 polyprenyl synthetase family protein [Kribbella antibiotica]
MSTLQETTSQGDRSAAEVLAWSREVVDPALRAAVASLPPATRRIADYHFGWADEEGRPAHADPGKAIRPALVLLTAQAVGGTTESALPAAVAVELVHNFSLLHDDVMDCDISRRHRATAWTVFGLGPAILAGDALLGLAFDVLVGSGPFEQTQSARGEAARILGASVQELVDGQLADAEFETRDDVVPAECVRMAQLKTGALLGCCTALGALLGGGRPDQVDHLRLYGEDLGLAYQYVDDLLGIWGTPSVTGKPVYSDLTRRKKSLPVVTALASGTPAARELAALYARTDELSADELTTAAALVETAGGRATSQAQADALLTAALGSLITAGAIAPASIELERLARLATRRDH